jgi:hypothetical protein
MLSLLSSLFKKASSFPIMIGPENCKRFAKVVNNPPRRNVDPIYFLNVENNL